MRDLYDAALILEGQEKGQSEMRGRGRVTRWSSADLRSSRGSRFHRFHRGAEKVGRDCRFKHHQALQRAGLYVTGSRRPHRQ